MSCEQPETASNNEIAMIWILSKSSGSEVCNQEDDIRWHHRP